MSDNPNYPFDQSGRPPSWKPPDQGPITVTKEMDARARFPVPKTDPNLVAVRYSDGRSVWESDSREDIKALLERVAELEARSGPTQEEFQVLVTWVRVLEERLQALEGKE